MPETPFTGSEQGPGCLPCGCQYEVSAHSPSFYDYNLWLYETSKLTEWKGCNLGNVACDETPWGQQQIQTS